MKQVQIYALINPIDDHVFYIGATTQPLTRRLSCHITDSKITSRPSKKELFINSLGEKGLKPEIINIDFVEVNEASFYEEFYIGLFKAYGYTLLQSPISYYTKGARFGARSQSALYYSSDRLENTILNLRIKSGLTQQEAADKINIKRSAYIRIEQGKAKKKPKPELLNKISEALNCNLKIDLEPRP